MKTISRRLQVSLAADSLQILRDIGQTAARRSESAYLVGGAVRDLLLGKDILDLDLAIEGKAVSLAKQIAREFDFEVKVHPRFGTATILIDSLRIDLVTARSETYRRPGALPTVQAGTIKDDLARRDFTVNSLAVNLQPDSFGELIDPYRGRDDLKNKLIRVLHPKSFMDDPTRMLRAIRYQQRLDFEIEPHTLKLLRMNLGCLETVSVERLWHEVELILNEPYPEKVFYEIEKLELAPYLCNAVKGAEQMNERFAIAREMDHAEMDLLKIYLSLLMLHTTKEETEKCITRFKMPGWAARTIRQTVDCKTSIPALNDPDLRPSQVYQILKRYLPEVIKATALAADLPIANRNVDLYLQTLIHAKPELDGRDLQEMGVRSGRKIGHILGKLKEARMDALVKSRNDEEEMVYRLLQ